LADTFGTRLAHAWNAFTGRENPKEYWTSGPVTTMRPSSVTRRLLPNDKSLIKTIYNQIAIDVSSVNFRHVRVDQNGRFKEEMRSDLNECLSVAPNLDQTIRPFIQSLVLSLFDEGAVALVPVDTTLNPKETESFDIRSMRVGRVVDWRPRYVTVEVYNDEDGQKHEILMPKKSVAIVENPMADVMNGPNSTISRLQRKLSILDSIDEAAGKGKLDLIIQLPYVIKSEARQEQAKKRQAMIDEQLNNSPHGIVYTDGTEKITQLNRPAENNLLDQIKFLNEELYNRLGMPADVFQGKATEEMMLNYWNRCVEPIVAAIADSMNRTFLTKTARTQGQRVIYQRDVFRNTTITGLANVADILIRNQVLTGNELRPVFGFPQSDEPIADQLGNPNVNQIDSYGGNSYPEYTDPTYYDEQEE
jgi:phage portal protein